MNIYRKHSGRHEEKASTRTRVTSPSLFVLPLCLSCLVGLLSLNACSSSGSERSITVSQNVPADPPTPIPTNTLTRSEMAATKVADDAPFMSRQATAAAHATNFALGTPYPTPIDVVIPTEEPPAPPLLGITGLCLPQGGQRPGSYTYYSCWVGQANGEYIFVEAGALTSDKEQGVVTVGTESVSTRQGTPDQAYDTPSRSGPVSIAYVDWPHMILMTRHDVDDTIPVVRFVFNLQTRTWEQPGFCQLFPIATSATSLQGLTDHYGTHDSNYGTGSHNFGWLSWDGSMITDTLATSLTPPGNSSSYTNPDNPSDHVVSVGDWVLGRPEVNGSNSPGVEAAMSNMFGGNINYNLPSGYAGFTVPVWDQATTQGGSIRYHVSGFAWINIPQPGTPQYSLAHPNHLTFYYFGHASCPDSP
jgi:hypothetical protein